MGAMFLSPKEEICGGLARRFRGAEQGSSGDLREREGKECSITVLSGVEKLRRDQLKKVLLMAPLNDYKVSAE